MKNKFYLSLFIAIFLLSATGLSAQSPKKILKQASKALGGEKALKFVRSYEKRGTIKRVQDGMTGSIEIRSTKPNFYNSIYDLRGFETEVGFNGRSGWIRDSRTGLRTLTGKASDDFKAEVFHRNWRWVNYKKRRARVNDGGKALIDGKQTDVVLLTTSEGVPIRMFFDPVTNLLLREEIPAGDTTKVFDYGDYRPVGKIKEPFQVSITNGDEKFEVRFNQIEHNTMISQGEFSFPRLSGEPLPDIPTLVKDLQANQEEIENILENYSYKQKVIKREITDKGILREKESETFQLSFYKGYRIRRLVEKNGTPLSAKEQAKEDRKVQNEVQDIEKKIRKSEARKVSQSSSGSPDGRGRNISIAEVLKASRLINPRRERLKGRDVIVFDFEPDPEFDFKNAQSMLKFFGKTGGVIWIDEKDKQVARIEAALFDSYKVGGGLLAKLRKGARFTLEQERVNNEIWLPTIADINLSIRVLLIRGVNINQVIESFDYRKFETEVKDAKVNELKDN
jgi:hypothetical protein